MTRGEQDLQAGSEIYIAFSDNVFLIRPFDRLNIAPVKRAGQCAFFIGYQDWHMREVRYPADMVDMRMTDDVESDIFIRQPQFGQLRHRHVFGRTLQHFAELVKPILIRGGLGVTGVFWRKSCIDNDVFIRVGSDQIATDTDDPSVGTDPEQSVIQHVERNRPPFDKSRCLHQRSPCPSRQLCGNAMKVKLHTLFQYLLETTEAEPEAFVGFSLASSPRLGDFLDALDPNLSLDWNQKSFRGLPCLRERVIEQAGLTRLCETDDVLITAGAAEANYLAFMQLVQPGDEVIVERPGWPQAEVLSNAVGAVVRVIDRDEVNRWSLPLDALEAAVSNRTRLIFLTNPNNPTGKSLDLGELIRLVDIASRVGAWLLVDEVYAGLEWNGARAPSIAGMYERGITTGSVSKALGLQGLRTGWLICRDTTLVWDAIILRENSSEIMNIMGETIAEIALRPERLGPALDKVRSAGRKTLTRLDQFIAGQPRLSWCRPDAGLIGLARLSDGMDGDEFARRLLADPYRVFLLPGSSYGMPSHVRLGAGGGEEAKLDLGLERMAALLSDWECDGPA